MLALSLPSNALHTACRQAARAKAPLALSTEVLSLICSAPAPRGPCCLSARAPRHPQHAASVHGGPGQMLGLSQQPVWPVLLTRACPSVKSRPGQPPLVVLGAARKLSPLAPRSSQSASERPAAHPPSWRRAAQAQQAGPGQPRPPERQAVRAHAAAHHHLAPPPAWPGFHVKTTQWGSPTGQAQEAAAELTWLQSDGRQGTRHPGCVRGEEPGRCRQAGPGAGREPGPAGYARKGGERGVGGTPLAHYSVKVRLASAGVVCCLSAAACLRAATLGLAPKRPPKSPPQSTMLNANARNTSPARPALVQARGNGSRPGKQRPSHTATAAGTHSPAGRRDSRQRYLEGSGR